MIDGDLKYICDGLHAYDDTCDIFWTLCLFMEYGLLISYVMDGDLWYICDGLHIYDDTYVILMILNYIYDDTYVMFMMLMILQYLLFINYKCNVYDAQLLVQEPEPLWRGSYTVSWINRYKSIHLIEIIYFLKITRKTSFHSFSNLNISSKSNTIINTWGPSWTYSNFNLNINFMADFFINITLICKISLSLPTNSLIWWCTGITK